MGKLRKRKRRKKKLELVRSSGHKAGDFPYINYPARQFGEGLGTNLDLPFTRAMRGSRKKAYHGKIVAGGYTLGNFTNPEIKWRNLQSTCTIFFKKFFQGNRSIKLKLPLVVNILKSESGCSLHYEPLGIYIAADNIAECKKEFQEEFLFLYDEYALEEDERLTEKAKELKRRILELVVD